MGWAIFKPPPKDGLLLKLLYIRNTVNETELGIKCYIEDSVTVFNVSYLLFALDQAIIFILFLASPAPFWRHINAIFLFLIALLFSLMYSCWLVLSRTVHRVEDQRRRARVQELVLRASRHNDHISSLNILLLSGDLSESCS